MQPSWSDARWRRIRRVGMPEASILWALIIRNRRHGSVLLSWLAGNGRDPERGKAMTVGRVCDCTCVSRASWGFSLMTTNDNFRRVLSPQFLEQIRACRRAATRARASWGFIRVATNGII